MHFDVVVRTSDEQQRRRSRSGDGVDRAHSAVNVAAVSVSRASVPKVRFHIAHPNGSILTLICCMPTCVHVINNK